MASDTPATSSREDDMFITYILVMFGLNSFLTGVNMMQKWITGTIIGGLVAICAFVVLIGECVCQ